MTMRAETELENGQDLLGRFWLAGKNEDRSHAAAGVLGWSTGDGVLLKLIGPLQDWPREVGVRVTVHGETVDGDIVTVLDALVSSTDFSGRNTIAITGPTLLLGEAVTASTRWRSMVVRTANLHEWFPETGLKPPEHTTDKRGRSTRVTATWELPAVQRLRLTRGVLTISPAMATEWSYAPTWSIRTDLDAIYKPTRPAALDDLYGGFAAPLLSLLIFAADRPDSIISEVVVDARTKTQARVLRRGDPVAPRDWRPDNAYLFTGFDLPNLEYAVNRWFDIFAATRPALGTFAEAIDMGRTYSPSRLIYVVTALESYATRWKKLKGNLIGLVKNLRDGTGVPVTTTGCTIRNIKLLVASRNYFAHLNRPNYGFTANTVENEVFETTRRATALMQACLLRDLGFTATTTRRLLDDHFANWPIPRRAA